MTRGLLTTAGLVGLFMAVTHAGAHLLRHQPAWQPADRLLDGRDGVLADDHRGRVPGPERDRQRAAAWTTFDNPKLNWTALVELVLAVLITQLEADAADLRHRADRRSTEWALALAPAVALFFVWEIGKLIARQRGPAAVATG